MGRKRLIAVAVAFAVLACLTAYLARRSRPASPPEKVPGSEASPLDGQGVAEVAPPNPVFAGSYNTWRIIYTAEKEGIPRGGGVALQISPWWRWTPPQDQSPEAPGYTTASTEAFGVELDVSANPDRLYALAIVKKGRLKPGQHINFVYGANDESGMGDGRARADAYAEREERFLVKTDGNADGFFAAIGESPRIRIVGGPPVRLLLTAPSMAVAGRPFKVAVAALDEAGNRSFDYAGPVSISSSGVNSVAPEKIVIPPEGEGAVLFEVTASREGIAVYEAVDEALGLKAVSNPVKIVPVEPEYKLYWADLHGHTNLSDGTGTPEDFYRYAREVSRLDVAAVTDHDHFGFMTLDQHPEIWERIKKAAGAAYKPGEFVTFLGYEFTDWQQGHYHALYPSDDGPLFSSSDPKTGDPNLLWKALGDRDAITVSHHVGGGPVATDWSYYNPRFEPLVEIVSVHGVSERYDAWGAIYNPRMGHFAADALAKGYRLGFVGSGDSHNGHPGIPDYSAVTGGIAGVWAKELTRESIWEALKARRTFASTNARIYLEFSINDAFMGRELKLEDPAERRFVKADIIAPAPVKTVELLKNNRVMALKRPNVSQYSFEFTDPDIAADGDYYYLRVRLANDEFAWSSPIWIDAP